MSGWDKNNVYYADLLSNESRPDSERILETKCTAFFENFRIENQYIYRDQLRRNVSLQQYYMVVELSHLSAFDEVLATQLSRRPAEIVTMLEEAAKKLARHICNLTENSEDGTAAVSIRDPLSDFQVQINSSTRPMTVRDLDSTNISKLVRIPGIVVSASNIIARPTNVHAVCRACGKTLNLPINSAFGGVSLPRSCSGSSQGTDVPNALPCPIDPYAIVADKCKCVDQQTLKIQESPDMVPVGELPRHVLTTVDRFLVNRVTPGTRVVINGIYSIFQSTSQKNGNSGSVAIRSPFIRVLGIQLEGQDGASSVSFDPTAKNFSTNTNSSSSRGNSSFTEAEEREMMAISKIPNLYSKFISSIAPSIFGNEDVKKAIACLLFGGSRKQLPDKMRIRGDINVLLLGDPGVAKSQFLKFVEKVSPISVYTSGKGSSAAGLTASVIRDPSSGDFYLEGGAMVLADGGVVCIDEFDKMNDEDRVAIHEAMEQQTISIAKAGITTILNSRTAVLAAANPIFGRYDEMKAPGENIDFSTTILSRFDMIFILKDEHNVQRDMTLARHVLNIHMQADSSTGSTSNNVTEFDLATMRNYIRYAKSRCAPRLTAEAAEKLSNHYVSIRADVQKVESKAAERSSIPITVRQLEAIIRISEALAKISLSPVATDEHVDEALRLFKVSTMQAVLAGHSLEGMMRPDLVKEVDKIEKVIRQRLPVGASLSYRGLVTELVGNKGFPEHAVNRAIEVMVQQEKLLLKNQRKVLLRQR